MSLPRIDVLNGKGHLTLEWNPDDQEAVDHMREEIDTLKKAGYTFFITEDELADEVAAGKGHLIGKLLVRRTENPVEELTEIAQEPARRRGRQPAAPTAVAVQPMRGG
jgi:hypothetical protein